MTHEAVGGSEEPHVHTSEGKKPLCRGHTLLSQAMDMQKRQEHRGEERIVGLVGVGWMMGRMRKNTGNTQGEGAPLASCSSTEYKMLSTRHSPQSAGCGG